MQKLAAGNVAFATIPVLEEAGWSDDGMQSVVRVDPDQVKDWVAGLLNDQDQGKTEEIAYSPDKTTVDVVNDSDVNGLAAAVSEVLSGKGFTGGQVGNNEAEHVPNSQVQAAKTDDLGAQAVARGTGRPAGRGRRIGARRVRCGWCWPADYTGPGSGLKAPELTAARPISVATPPTGSRRLRRDRLPRRRRSSPPAPTIPKCVN